MPDLLQPELNSKITGGTRMPTHRLEFAWLTDRGRVREGNEDAVGVYPDSGLVIVADGMGGASAGEVASDLAVRTVSDCFQSDNGYPEDKQQALQRAEQAVEAANRAILESARATPRYTGMGTTLVIGYVDSDWLVFAHVGDSRLYRLRDGGLVQLTRDHSLIQEVVDQGFFPTLEDAQRYGINRNILTRALGTTDPVAVDFGEDDLCPGDLYLFCTDGLTGMVTDAGITRLLMGAGDDLNELSRALIDLACEGGGLDNISVVLMRVC